MLSDFLTTHQEELVARCRVKVATRSAPQPSEAELEHGIPLFLQQLIDTLQAHRHATSPPMARTATQHGHELLRKGFTVAQVIYDYGDLCQAITELATERKSPITAEEFGTLNRCLDDAIAGAVTEYALQREKRLDDGATHETNLRLGLLAHELRNLLSTATLSFEAIKQGSVAINGITSAIHDRTLRRLTDLVTRSLADVRLSVGIQRERILLAGFIKEVEIAAALEANAYGIRLTVSPGGLDLIIDADRQILAAVLANLLQNAFKFTREHGHIDVALRVLPTVDHVRIAVEDGCGGLPAGNTEALFRPFTQGGKDRSGAGLGLTICRRGVEANGGQLHVRDVPGRGCVFTIELPLWPEGHSGDLAPDLGLTISRAN